MAKFRQGILGGFSGKVGPIVGYTWKGKNCMRTLPLSFNDAKTTVQLQNRRKFTLLTKFLSSSYEAVAIGFKDQAVGMTEINAAVKSNFDDCVTGTWPSYTLNYSKLMVSKGSLANPYSPSVTAQGCDLNFSWTDNSGIGNAKDTDLVMIVVYNDTKNEAAIDTASAPRSARQASFSLPSSWTGDTVEVYLATHRADGSESSNSLYLGSFTI
ncbi:MAG: hypothetical protein J6X86_04620 [Bacteroidales bacterium]|nr:hypothetical protein [Bacteroidales bacterium]